MTRRGWAFPIDYAKAIADGDRCIAWAERCIKHGWYRRPIGTHGYIAHEFWELVLYFPDVSQAAGFSLQDVADFAAGLDAELAWTYNSSLPGARKTRAGYRRGLEVDAEIARIGGWLFADEAAARLELRKAKASRARHVRNQR